jgi:hypothetical protein
MVKAGVFYSMKGYRLGLFNSYYDEAQRINSASQVNPDADAYNLLTLKLATDISREKLPAFFPNTSLELFVDNLLDEDIYFPEVNRGRINTIPIRAGVSGFGKLILKY